MTANNSFRKTVRR